MKDLLNRALNILSIILMLYGFVVLFGTATSGDIGLMTFNEEWREAAKGFVFLLLGFSIGVSRGIIES